MTRILLVDDEPSILEVLTAYFEKENWDVDSSMNGKEALAMIETHHYDIILLDLMLPDMTGEEICQRTRETSDVPIIMLTAKSQEEDLINGIVIGADDYIKKPFSPKEVVIRSKALLRRIGMMTQDQTDAVSSFNKKTLIINEETKSVTAYHEEVALTPIEYKLLTALARFPGRVYSRADLLDRLEDDGVYVEGYERVIDTHIKNLRKKIEQDSKSPDFIVTVFGMGYKFNGKVDHDDITF